MRGRESKMIGQGLTEEQIPDKLKKFKNYIDKKRLEMENNNENTIKLKKEIKDFFDFFPEFNQYSQIFNKLDNKETKETKKRVSKEDILKLINEIESSIIPRTDNKDIKKGTKMLKKIEKKLKQQQPEQEQEIPDQLRNFQYYIDKKRLEVENNYNKSLKDEDAKEDYDDDIREIKMDVKEYFNSYPELKKYVQIYNPFNKEESEEYVRQMIQKQQKKQPQIPQPKKETKKRVSKEDFQKLIDEIQSSLIQKKPDENLIEQGNEILQNISSKLADKYNKEKSSNVDTIFNLSSKRAKLDEKYYQLQEDLENISKKIHNYHIQFSNSNNTKEKSKELKKLIKENNSIRTKIKKEIRQNRKDVKDIQKIRKELEKKNKVIKITVEKIQPPLKVKTPGRQGRLRAILEQRGEKEFLKELENYKVSPSFNDMMYNNYLNMLEAYKRNKEKKKLEKEEPKEKKPRGRPKKIINN
jgi:hypothetical protein